MANVSLNDAMRSLRANNNSVVVVPGRGLADALNSHMGGRGRPEGGLETRRFGNTIQSVHEKGADFKDKILSYLKDPFAYKAKVNEAKKMACEAKRNVVTIAQQRLMTASPKTLFPNTIDLGTSVAIGQFQLMQVQTRYLLAMARQIGVTSRNVMQPLTDPQKGFFSELFGGLVEDLGKLPGISQALTVGKHAMNIGKGIWDFVNPFTIGKRVAESSQNYSKWMQRLILGDEAFELGQDPEKLKEKAGLKLTDNEKLINAARATANYAKEQTNLQFKMLQILQSIESAMGFNTQLKDIDLTHDEYSGELKSKAKASEDALKRQEAMQREMDLAIKKGWGLARFSGFVSDIVNSKDYKRDKESHFAKEIDVKAFQFLAQNGAFRELPELQGILKEIGVTNPADLLSRKLDGEAKKKVDLLKTRIDELSQQDSSFNKIIDQAYDYAKRSLRLHGNVEKSIQAANKYAPNAGTRRIAENATELGQLDKIFEQFNGNKELMGTMFDTRGKKELEWEQNNTLGGLIRRYNLNQILKNPFSGFFGGTETLRQQRELSLASQPPNANYNPEDYLVFGNDRRNDWQRIGDAAKWAKRAGSEIWDGSKELFNWSREKGSELRQNPLETLKEFQQWTDQLIMNGADYVRDLPGNIRNAVVEQYSEAGSAEATPEQLEYRKRMGNKVRYEEEGKKLPDTPQLQNPFILGIQSAFITSLKQIFLDTTTAKQLLANTNSFAYALVHPEVTELCCDERKKIEKKSWDKEIVVVPDQVPEDKQLALRQQPEIEGENIPLQTNQTEQPQIDTVSKIKEYFKGIEDSVYNALVRFFNFVNPFKNKSDNQPVSTLLSQTNKFQELGSSTGIESKPNLESLSEGKEKLKALPSGSSITKLALPEGKSENLPATNVIEPEIVSDDENKDLSEQPTNKSLEQLLKNFNFNDALKNPFKTFKTLINSPEIRDILKDVNIGNLIKNPLNEFKSLAESPKLNEILKKYDIDSLPKRQLSLESQSPLLALPSGSSLNKQQLALPSSESILALPSAQSQLALPSGGSINKQQLALASGQQLLALPPAQTPLALTSGQQLLALPQAQTQLALPSGGSAGKINQLALPESQSQQNLPALTSSKLPAKFDENDNVLTTAERDKQLEDEKEKKEEEEYKKDVVGKNLEEINEKMGKQLENEEENKKSKDKGKEKKKGIWDFILDNIGKIGLLGGALGLLFGPEKIKDFMGKIWDLAKEHPFISAGIGAIILAKIAPGAIGKVVGTLLTKAFNPVTALGLLAGAGLAYNIYSSITSAKEGEGFFDIIKRILVGGEGGVANALGKAGTYAILGAGIASVVPGIGTIVGFLAGAAIGGIIGYMGEENMDKYVLHSEGLVCQWMGWKSGSHAHTLAPYGRYIPYVGPYIMGYIGSIMDAFGNEEEPESWFAKYITQTSSLVSKWYGWKKGTYASKFAAWGNILPYVGPYLMGFIGSFVDSFGNEGEADSFFAKYVTHTSSTICKIFNWKQGSYASKWASYGNLVPYVGPYLLGFFGSLIDCFTNIDFEAIWDEIKSWTKKIFSWDFWFGKKDTPNTMSANESALMARELGTKEGLNESGISFNAKPLGEIKTPPPKIEEKDTKDDIDKKIKEAEDLYNASLKLEQTKKTSMQLASEGSLESAQQEYAQAQQNSAELKRRLDNLRKQSESRNQSSKDKNAGGPTDEEDKYFLQTFNKRSSIGIDSATKAQKIKDTKEEFQDFVSNQGIPKQLFQTLDKLPPDKESGDDGQPTQTPSSVGAAQKAQETSNNSQSAQPAANNQQPQPQQQFTGDLKDWGQYVKQFESGSGGASVVVRDTDGGTAYGTYQMNAKQGGFQDFLKWAEKSGGELGRNLSRDMNAAGPVNTGSSHGPAVDVWKKYVSQNKAGIEQLEHAHMASRVADSLKRLPEDLRKFIQSDRGLMEAYWSTVVQHGPNYAPSRINKGAQGIFRDAWERTNHTNDPAVLLKNVYENRHNYFSRKSDQESQKLRFQKEYPVVRKLSGKPFNGDTDTLNFAGVSGGISGGGVSGDSSGGSVVGSAGKALGIIGEIGKWFGGVMTQLGLGGLIGGNSDQGQQTGTSPGVSTDYVNNTGAAVGSGGENAPTAGYTKTGGEWSNYPNITSQDLENWKIPASTPLVWPGNSNVITSPTGYRNPGGPGSKAHKGIDIRGATGEPIKAAMGGKVIGTDPSRLGMTTIQHPNGFTTRYLHQSKIGVKVGQEVQPGEVIGQVGSVFSKGKVPPHLHFDVIKDGKWVDPEGMFYAYDKGGGNSGYARHTYAGIAANRQLPAKLAGQYMSKKYIAGVDQNAGGPPDEPSSVSKVLNMKPDKEAGGPSDDYQFNDRDYRMMSTPKVGGDEYDTLSKELEKLDPDFTYMSTGEQVERVQNYKQVKEHGKALAGQHKDWNKKSLREQLSLASDYAAEQFKKGVQNQDPQMMEIAAKHKERRLKQIERSNALRKSIDEENKRSQEQARRMEEYKKTPAYKAQMAEQEAQRQQDDATFKHIESTISKTGKWENLTAEDWASMSIGEQLERARSYQKSQKQKPSSGGSSEAAQQANQQNEKPQEVVIKGVGKEWTPQEQKDEHKVNKEETKEEKEIQDKSSSLKSGSSTPAAQKATGGNPEIENLLGGIEDRMKTASAPAAEKAKQAQKPQTQQPLPTDFNQMNSEQRSQLYEETVARLQKTHGENLSTATHEDVVKARNAILEERKQKQSNSIPQNPSSVPAAQKAQEQNNAPSSVQEPKKPLSQDEIYGQLVQANLKGDKAQGELKSLADKVQKAKPNSPEFWKAQAEFNSKLEEVHKIATDKYDLGNQRTEFQGKDENRENFVKSQKDFYESTKKNNALLQARNAEAEKLSKLKKGTKAYKKQQAIVKQKEKAYLAHQKDLQEKFKTSQEVGQTYTANMTDAQKQLNEKVKKSVDQAKQQQEEQLASGSSNQAAEKAKDVAGTTEKPQYQPVDIEDMNPEDVAEQAVSDLSSNQKLQETLNPSSAPAAEQAKESAPAESQKPKLEDNKLTKEVNKSEPGAKMKRKPRSGMAKGKLEPATAPKVEAAKEELKPQSNQETQQVKNTDVEKPKKGFWDHVGDVFSFNSSNDQDPEEMAEQAVSDLSSNTALQKAIETKPEEPSAMEKVAADPLGIGASSAPAAEQAKEDTAAKEKTDEKKEDKKPKTGGSAAKAQKAKKGKGKKGKGKGSSRTRTGSAKGTTKVKEKANTPKEGDRNFVGPVQPASEKSDFVGPKLPEVGSAAAAQEAGQDVSPQSNQPKEEKSWWQRAGDWISEKFSSKNLEENAQKLAADPLGLGNSVMPDKQMGKLAPAKEESKEQPQQESAPSNPAPQSAPASSGGGGGGGGSAPVPMPQQTGGGGGGGSQGSVASGAGGSSLNVGDSIDGIIDRYFEQIGKLISSVNIAHTNIATTTT